MKRPSVKREATELVDSAHVTTSYSIVSKCLLQPLGRNKRIRFFFPSHRNGIDARKIPRPPSTSSFSMWNNQRKWINHLGTWIGGSVGRAASSRDKERDRERVSIKTWFKPNGLYFHDDITVSHTLSFVLFRPLSHSGKKGILFFRKMAKWITQSRRKSQKKIEINSRERKSKENKN